MLKNVFSFLGVTIFERLASFVITAYCIRQLTKEDYATFGLALVTISLFSMFIDAGQNGWLRTVYLKAHSNYRRALSNAVTASAVLFLISSIFFIFFLSGYLRLTNGQVALVLVCLVFYYADQLIASILITRQDALSYRDFRLIAVGVGFFCFFFIQYFLPAFDLLSVRLLGLAIGASVGVFLYRSVFLLDISGGSKHLSTIAPIDHFKFVFPLLISGFSVNAILNLDRWIIEISGNTVLLAEILVVFTLISPLGLIGDVVGKQFTARFTLYMKEGKTRKLAREQMLVTTLLLIISVGVAIFGYSVIGLYAGQEYQTESVQYLVWGLAFYPILKIIYQFQLRSFMFHEKTIYLMVFPMLVGITYLTVLYQMQENLDYELYVKLFIGSSIMTSVLTFLSRLFLLNSKVQ